MCVPFPKHSPLVKQCNNVPDLWEGLSITRAEGYTKFLRRQICAIPGSPSRPIPTLDVDIQEVTT